MTPTPNASLPLWAKLDRDRGDWLSLVEHSADVAAVLESILLLPTFMDRLSHLAGRRLRDVDVSRLAALAFLHDIGKANRGFRSRFHEGVRGAGHIQPMAWLLRHADAMVLQERLAQSLHMETWADWLPEGALPLLDAVFAHHGRPWQTEGLPDHSGYWRAGADMDPVADLVAIGDALPRWFPTAFREAPPLPERPAFHHAFAGLLMLADWLGSDRAWFPLVATDQADRMVFARRRAANAIVEVGLNVESLRGRVRAAAPSFAMLFGVATPRQIQEYAPVPQARAVILEAETGSGKTEAALWRFLHLFHAGAVDGLYFALPTRVAATQVFHRVLRFCDRAFGNDRPAVVLAVPGQQMADGVRGHPLPDFGFAWDDDVAYERDRTRWAAEHPKRFLAAHIAVGTIDQALLGAIQVRHAHMRSAALLRQLLVVDEVHASDRYMERLLCGLLRGHLQAGGHALLLSATLGAGMRARLLGTPLPMPEAAAQVSYPALSWAEERQERRLVVASEGEKSVAMTLVAALDDPAAIAAQAIAAARAGARVLIIRNTVGAAIATQLALEAADPDARHLFKVAGVATLHHGRFAAEDRRLLDDAVERLLGRNGITFGAVIAGTQTLEVSLDLDADLLLTDLCPADVLLQRIGRLHRHARGRPAGFETPSVTVLVPADRDLLPLGRRPRHGLGGTVYDDMRIIEATWRLLEAYPVWHIPTMNRTLVEGATHPALLEMISEELLARDTAWRKVFSTTVGAWTGQVQHAGYALLDHDIPFDRLVFDSDDRLATRLGAADRLLEFSPLPGPFARPVSRLRVPHHLLPLEAGEAGDLVALDGGFAFSLGGRRFHYDRHGLHADGTVS